MLTGERLQYLADLLPENVSWGDPLNAVMLDQILAAHGAGAQTHKIIDDGEVVGYVVPSIAAHPAPQTDAARDVLAERQRQVNVEGWTTKHDDLHTDFGAAKAAAVYALHAADTVGVYSHFWPWEPHWWKPSTPRRDLVKAGALVLAEIERLDRAKGE